MLLREDETWHRLREWTRGQATSERLAAQLLIKLGYENIDPSHPLGGKDGGRDAICTKDGKTWIMAAYFPRGQQSFAKIRNKFLEDVAKASPTAKVGIVFVTNQEITLAERSTIKSLTNIPTDLVHLERATALLDMPTMAGVRAQFLNIDFLNDDLKRALTKEIVETSAQVKAAITGGETWGYVMLYDFDLKANIAKNFVYVREGEHPLYQVRTRILDIHNGRQIRIDDWGEISAPAAFQLLRWPMSRNVYYRVFHEARNGQWHQDLILNKAETANCWLCATRVSDFSGHPRWTHVDVEFVATFGEPIWRP